MTLFERDALAVLLSINTVFWVLLSPLTPIAYSLYWQSPNIYITTLFWGVIVGAVGVAFNHYVARRDRRTS